MDIPIDRELRSRGQVDNIINSMKAEIIKNKNENLKDKCICCNKPLTLTNRSAYFSVCNDCVQSGKFENFCINKGDDRSF